MTKKCGNCSKFISYDEEYCSDSCSNGLTESQYINNCKNCGEELVTTKSEDKKYCNNSCYSADTTKDVSCSYCGTTFSVPNSIDRTYCSKNCEAKHYSEERFSKENHPDWKGGKITKECINCDSEFKVWPKRSDAKYCCMNCMAKDYEVRMKGEKHPRYTKVKVECSGCGKTLERKNCHATRYSNFYCSNNCLSNWMSENSVGSNSPNWKGGHVEYYGKNWIEMRDKTLERDSFECQVCGKNKDNLGKNPSVHHIKPVRTFDNVENANYLDNLITLCEEHHKKVEGWQVVPSNLTG